MKRLMFFSFWALIPFFTFAQNMLMDTNDIAMAKEVMRQVNAYRVSQGLNEVKMQEELNEIAFEHSLSMAKGEVGFSHDGFSSRVKDVKQFAYVPYKVAENLYAIRYKRSGVPKKALTGWINSPGHKRNMEGKFLFTGIGVARSADGEYFVTQLFVGKNEDIKWPPPHPRP